MSEHTNTLSRRAFIGTAAALGAVTMAAPNIAFGATAAEKQAEADAVRNQLVSLQADLEAASDNYYGALDEQQAAQDAMAAEQAKIDDTNAQIQELQGKLSTRARSMYRTGSASFLDFVLGASSFDEFTSNWDLLTQMNNNDSEMVNTSKQLREQLQASKDEYARQEQIAADKAAEAAQIQQEVQAKVDQATELVNSLDAEAKELLEQEQAAAAAAAAAEKAAANRNNGSGGGSSSGGGSTSSGGGYSGNGVDVPSHGSVVDYAMSRIGCPYIWAAEGPNAFDCSGLVRWAYLQVGISLPHQSESLYNCASWRGPVSEARPGDVLWRHGHVGIAVNYGGTHYVHAPTEGAYVRDTDDLSWSRFTHSLRF